MRAPDALLNAIAPLDSHTAIAAKTAPAVPREVRQTLQ